MSSLFQASLIALQLVSPRINTASFRKDRLHMKILSFLQVVRFLLGNTFSLDNSQTYAGEMAIV